MFSALRVINTRVQALPKKSSDLTTQQSQRKPLSTLAPPTVAPNSRNTRMVQFAQAWKKPVSAARSLRTPRAQVQSRNLHTSAVVAETKGKAWSVTPAAIGLKKNTIFEMFQGSAWVLAAAVPVSMLFSPSFLTMPLDVLMGFAIPYHAWYGMSHVLEDYMPPEFLPASNMLLYIITAICVLGLLNLNFRGDGITETILGLWRDDKDKKEKK